MAKTLTQTTLKAVGLFGSMQMVQVVCTLLRLKVITLLTGAVGVGLMGVYFNTLDLVSTVSQLGIRTSAVSDIAAAESAGRRRNVILTLRRYAWLLGVVGAVALFLLAPTLSHRVFSSVEGTAVWGFRLLSVSVLLTSLASGEQAVLQGRSLLTLLATANMWGCVGGLLLSLPIYWWLRIDGVAWSILAYSLCSLLGYVYAARRSPREEAEAGPKPGWRESLAMGSGFIKVGIFLTLAAIITSAVNWGMTVWMEHTPGNASVNNGLYQAGSTMLWKYAAMFFVSVSYEYFPRIARFARTSKWRTSVMVGHESALLTWLYLPCACAAIAAAQPLVRLLYSGEFLPMVSFFVWGMVGMMLRAQSMSMSYCFLARGSGRSFFITEVVSGVSGVGLQMLGYLLCGFTGLGLGTIAWMVVDVAVVYAVYRREGLRLNSRVWLTSLTATAYVAVCAAMQQWGLWWASAAMAAAGLWWFMKKTRKR